MLKEIRYNKEARDKILSGVKKITDAVRVTMGSNGRCVLIGEAYFGNDGMIALPTIVTKDGYTVTKHFELADRMENRGALMIKEAAMKTVMQAGDATTCTCVLAEAIISEGMRLIDEGANAQELKKGIDDAVAQAVNELKKMSIMVGDDTYKIFQVATVSANNDAIIGHMIAEAFKKIGVEGVIDVEEGVSPETDIKISDGYKFERSWAHPLFINNKEKQTCEFNDALVILYDKKINHHTQITKAIEAANKEEKPLLIICEDAVDEGLAFLVVNVHKQRTRVCVVKAPAFGEDRRIEMEDIALLTGAEFIGDVRGINIREFHPSYFGTAKKIVVNKDETIIMGGGGDKEMLKKQLDELRMDLARAKNENERVPVEKRIAKLTGGVAVIQVGAATETEMKEKYARFDDAVRATKAAIAEGFVAGGGTAFLRISDKLLIDDNASPSYQNGQRLIKDALLAPIKQMSQNSGINPEATCEGVRRFEGNVGWNTIAEDFVDMVNVGIIDSTKALRCALQNAASVAGMLLITECHIEQIG